MRIEEEEILPLAEAVYEALFATILRITPAPFGLGPRGIARICNDATSRKARFHVGVIVKPGT
jgi:hypothetical protein